MDVLNILGKYTKSGEKQGAPKRFASLCLCLGIPDKRIKYIHVAGTNGKGSVCEYIESALCASGRRKNNFKAGKFTSPYIVKINERITLNSVPISDEDLDRLCRKAAKFADKESSQFEILTAAALMYFSEQKADYAVIETGIGGLLDCTNIITPKVSVITRIAADHTDILGKTLSEIAAHKAGIIKEHVPVVTDPRQDAKVMETISETARKKDSRIVIPDLDCLEVKEKDLLGNVFSYRNSSYTSYMGGEHQVCNALTAIEALEILGISEEFIKAGILNARLNARMQIFSKNPLVILDGAHNPDGIKAARKTFEKTFEKTQTDLVVVAGMIKSKDCVNCIKELLAVPGAGFVLTDGFSPDAAPAEELAKICRGGGAQRVFTEKDEFNAVEKAKDILREDIGRAILVTGSLYLAGAYIKAFESRKKKEHDAFRFLSKKKEKSKEQ